MFAAVRFFSGMNQHVALEVDFLCGGEIALCASKGLLTTVYQHMSFQFAGRVACVVALIATVRLLSIIPTLLGIFCKFVTIHVVFFTQANKYSARLEGN